MSSHESSPTALSKPRNGGGESATAWETERVPAQDADLARSPSRPSEANPPSSADGAAAAEGTSKARKNDDTLTSSRHPTPPSPHGDSNNDSGERSERGRKSQGRSPYPNHNDSTPNPHRLRNKVLDSVPGRSLVRRVAAPGKKKRLRFGGGDAGTDDATGVVHRPGASAHQPPAPPLASQASVSLALRARNSSAYDGEEDRLIDERRTGGNRKVVGTSESVSYGSMASSQSYWLRVPRPCLTEERPRNAYRNQQDEGADDPTRRGDRRRAAGDDVTQQVVRLLERHLRAAICLLVAYLLGFYHGKELQAIYYQQKQRGSDGARSGDDDRVAAPAAARFILEYLGVAWCTCLLILSGSFIAQHLRQREDQVAGETQKLLGDRAARSERGMVSAPAEDDEEAVPLLVHDATHAAPEEENRGEDGIPRDYSSPCADNRASRVLGLEGQAYEAPLNDAEELLNDADPSREAPSVTLHPSNTSQMPHPDLESLYIMDTNRKTRVVPNLVSNSYALSTEYFDGEMVALIRTADVADVNSIECSNDASGVGLSMDDRNRAAREYLTGKQRRFEFQFQLRLKKVPTGRVYFGVQLEEPVKLGVIQRAFVSAAMAFVRTTNPSFHYSFGSSTSNNVSGVRNPTDNEDIDESYTKKPMMAFPVEEGMNRVVITPQGQLPPKLGTAIFEEAESAKKRRKCGVAWNLQDTYTFAVWSAYVDFVDWRCLNLPGIRPFQLEGVIGIQPMAVVLYEDAGSGKKLKILELEVSNLSKNAVGPIARSWMASQHLQLKVPHSELRAPMETNTLVIDDGVETFLETDTLDEVTDVAEEAKLAALGEGIYVESGNRVVLREVLPINGLGLNEVDKSCFVTYSGGFCVLQDQSCATIVIEKFGKSRRASSSSKLIRSGDSVMFRLEMKRGDGSDETHYLSTHRGWWLKWVSHVPTKNGVFTIHTHEAECSNHDDDDLSGSKGPDETQQSYLTWGNSFYLRHKRWSKYEVGVAALVSATYGGRLLGLYSSKGNYDEDFGQFDDFDNPVETGSSASINVDPGKPKEWMKPLQLRAFEAGAISLSPSNTSLRTSEEESGVEGADVEKLLHFSAETLRLDVPAWIEMLNRKDRVPQLAYAVRVSPQRSLMERESNDISIESFVRLRTGRQLSHVMRVGQQWRNSISPSSPRRSRQESLSSEGLVAGSPKKYVTPLVSVASADFMPVAAPLPPPSEDPDDIMDDDDSASSGSADWFVESGDDFEIMRQADEEIEGESAVDVSNRSRRRSRRRKLIGSIASKSKTVVRTGMKVGKDTGKSVVRSGVMVGKGTVNAGKAIIAPMSKQRQPHEPTPSKVPGRSAKKRKEKDFGAAVSRSMMRFGRMSPLSPTEAPSILAGELSALEQSCRTVSAMLTTMSSLSPSDGVLEQFSILLAQEVKQLSEQDTWFLGGSATQLGVVVQTDRRNQLRHDIIVARCLWESHWREEWCGIFESSVSFYSPLSTSPCLEIPLEDIQSVRDLKDTPYTPLPGFYLLAIETAWICRYIAFAGTGQRKEFKSQIEVAMAQANAKRDQSLQQESALVEARFWQGFTSSAKSSEGKWAKVVSGIHRKSRVILNSRRMTFDLPEVPASPDDFVAGLLATSLSFSKLTHLKDHPELLVAFLDAASQLRRLPWQVLDLSGASAFCFFVNLYHCLLQHALLFAVNGPLNKRSFGHFMRTSCYELGGEVFSLAELHTCVIRGNMSRPLTYKPPAIEVPKQSNNYRFYALGYTNPRVNFVLNTGDLSSPQDVVVLTPENLFSLLNEQSVAFLRRNVTVDATKRLVVLPRICDVYRYDFSSPGVTAGLSCVRYCLSFLDTERASAIRALLEDESSIVVRYHSTSDQYRTSLTRKEPGMSHSLQSATP